MEENEDSDKENKAIRKKCTGREAWTILEEDNILKDLAGRTVGKRKRNEIGDGSSVMTGKQCRERWLNQINPNLRKEPLTREEKLTIRETQSKHGNILPSPKYLSDNRFQNHWHSFVKKEAHRCKKDIVGSQDEKRSRIFDLCQKYYSGEKVKIVDCITRPPVPHKDMTPQRRYSIQKKNCSIQRSTIDWDGAVFEEKIANLMLWTRPVAYKRSKFEAINEQLQQKKYQI